MAEKQSLQCVQPEGKDVQLFRVRMRGIFKQIAVGVSLEDFEKIYGRVLGGRRSVAKRLHKIWQESLLTAMENELNEIIIDCKLDEKLKLRAKIIEECQEDRNKIPWRPPGNAVEHIRSLDMKEKIQSRNELEAFVRSKEAEVEQLIKEVSDGRAYVSNLERDLSEQKKKLGSIYEREKKYQNELEVHFKQLIQQD